MRFAVLIRIRVLASLLLICHGLPMLGQQSVASAVNLIVPPMVQFSGVLTDLNGKPLTGVVGVTFCLYKDSQGGAPLWMETQNVQPSKAGHYSVMLGSTTSQGLPIDLFVSGEARWLGVQPQGQSEQPRVLLLSVPYALKAGDAETVGGLPPSAFVLATPAPGMVTAPSVATNSISTGSAPPASTITGSGTVNFLPLWTGTNTIGNSVLFQSGTGSTAKVGINTNTPASTLDVKGAGTIRGLLSLPAAGTATASKGANSQPFDLTASAFNSSTNAAVAQTFQWQAEPAGNDTTSPSGTLNLLFGSGTSKPAETGLKISNTGIFGFATGQTFPGTGNGTITGVTAGTDLTGGGTSGNVTINLDTTKVVSGVLAGTDLTGGGTGGVQTLNLDTTKVPQLSAANTFTGNQTVSGNLSATGVVTGSAFQIGSNLFAFGSYANSNAMLGFAGNSTMTGLYNTASGYQALFSNTSGFYNTASGNSALLNNTIGGGNTASGSLALGSNTAGGANTASGYQTLLNNTTGGNNTASGFVALFSNTTGFNNTASGYEALFSNTTGFGNTASGYQALLKNTTSSGNTAEGYAALQYNTSGLNNTGMGAYAGNPTNGQPTTGSSNTYVGVDSNPGTQLNLSNATAIGANAQVTTSNALVLGSINGVNSATADALVGIGTTAPTYKLHVGTINNGFRVEGPATGGSGAVAASFGGFGDVGIDAPGIVNGRFVVKDSGFVGIGTASPANTLEVGFGGTTLADAWTTRSSRRWKANIHTLDGALAKVEQLRGVSYDLKESGKHEVGVIAEEVGAVVPEIVSWEKNGKDAQGVDYSRLTALLIEATKEQQTLIHNQQAQIKAQQAQIVSLTLQVTAIQTSLRATSRADSGMRNVKAQERTVRQHIASLWKSKSRRRSKHTTCIQNCLAASEDQAIGSHLPVHAATAVASSRPMSWLAPEKEKE